VNQAGIFLESIRQKKKLAINRLCEWIERPKEAEIGYIRGPQFPFDAGNLLIARSRRGIMGTHFFMAARARVRLETDVHSQVHSRTGKLPLLLTSQLCR
jgi:hypothetical protein